MGVDAGLGRFVGVPSVEELERCFFLDDADLALVARRRGDHNRLGFAVQLATVRFLGTFLTDPTDVPTEVVDYVAGQLMVTDPSCVKQYLARRSTRFEHAAEITAVYGYREFSEVDSDLVAWVNDRAWTTGDGPVALVAGAVRWLRERRVLLPGPSRLERLVARSREVSAQRLWDTLAGLVTVEQADRLDRLLDVPDWSVVSELERLRRGPTVVSARGLLDALERVDEIAAWGFSSIDAGAVPVRRLLETARWGMNAKARAVRRSPRPRRTATLVATMLCLAPRAIDDALELFDALMVTDVLAKAQRETAAVRARNYPVLSRDGLRCAAAVKVLLGCEPSDTMTVAELWEQIESVVSRDDLAGAVDRLTDLVPELDSAPDLEARRELVAHAPKVRRFLPALVATIEFDATAGAMAVLAAFRELPGLLASGSQRRTPAEFVAQDRVQRAVVPAGAWQQVVFPPGGPAGQPTVTPT